MALGLGFANPELRRAQMLAQLNGSTALPQGAGAPTEQIGPPLDLEGRPTPAANPQPLPMPNIPIMGPGGRPSPQDVAQLPVPVPPVGPNDSGAAQQPPAQEQEGGGSRWARIAGAIGHVLLSTDAGYRGKPQPRYDDPLKAEQDEAMQAAEFLINTTARAWEVSRKASPEQRGPMLAAFKQAINRVAPDFDFDAFIEGMQTDPERADELAPTIATMSPEAKQMFMARVRAQNGDAASVLKDDQFMDSLVDFEDSRNVPALRFKLNSIKGAMDRLKMPPDALEGLTPDNIDALNEQLPEQFRLSPHEIATLKRNPELIGILGVKTEQADDEPTLDSRAGVKPPPSPRPGAASPPPARSTTQPRASAASSTPPSRNGGPPQGQSQKRAAQQRAPGPDDLDGPPIMPKGEGPVYTRPGYDPQYADPAFQASLKKGARKQGATRGQVEDAMTERGARQQQSAAPKMTPAPRVEQKANALQRYKAPKDMTIPGVGKVKQGDVIVYDPSTKTYRRG